MDSHSAQRWSGVDQEGFSDSPAITVLTPWNFQETFVSGCYIIFFPLSRLDLCSYFGESSFSRLDRNLRDFLTLIFSLFPPI